MISDEVLQGGPEAWLDALPPFHARRIREMQAAGVGMEDIARAYLASVGPADNAPYGVVEGGKKGYWDAVKGEVDKFICGGAGYDDLRKQVEAGWEKGKTWIVTAVAGFVATNLGVAAAVILPVVGIALALAARIGVKAYCAMGDG